MYTRLRAKNTVCGARCVVFVSYYSVWISIRYRPKSITPKSTINLIFAYICTTKFGSYNIGVCDKISQNEFRTSSIYSFLELHRYYLCYQFLVEYAYIFSPRTQLRFETTHDDNILRKTQSSREREREVI